MPTPTIIQANLSEHRSQLLSLNIEYMSWVLAEIERCFGVTIHEAIGMSVAEYVAAGVEKVCAEVPPRGVFYLLEVEGQLAGMGGLRYLRPGVAELKRIYVRPGQRGMQLGRLLLERLLSDARAFGYASVCLDSAPFMQSAQRLYQAHGFTDCSAYQGVEAPQAFHAHWRFMQRPLS